MQDAIVIALSMAAAWCIVHYGAVGWVLPLFGDSIAAASFVTGIFFTSIATTAPAIAVLGELSLHGNPVVVALVGALGAVVGDYGLFSFVRDRISKDAAFLLRGPRATRVLHIFRHRRFRRLLPFVGAVIIASPLPDELGLALLGLSGVRNRYFFAISYGMNAVGILFVELAARGLGW